MKTITREEIINMVNENNFYNLNYSTIKRVLEELDKVIFRILSDRYDDANEKEDIKLKILNGISIDRKYIEDQIPDKGIFKGKMIPEHYNVKANVSEYYTKRINESAFKENIDISNHF